MRKERRGLPSPHFTYLSSFIEAGIWGPKSRQIPKEPLINYLRCYCCVKNQLKMLIYEL